MTEGERRTDAGEDHFDDFAGNEREREEVEPQHGVEETQYRTQSNELALARHLEISAISAEEEREAQFLDLHSLAMWEKGQESEDVVRLLNMHAK